MMKKTLPLLIIASLVLVLVFNLNKDQIFPNNEELTSQQAWDRQLKEKKESKKNGSHKYDSPNEFVLFQQGIRTKEGEKAPSYPANYILNELTKAKSLQAAFYGSNAKSRKAETLNWTERGPANVPGRTRAIVVMPQDATHNTWVIGSVGGGIWKTTDGGTSWVEKSKDLPNIAFTTIALAESNPNVLYAGTGEGGFFNVDGIQGNGVFKSSDAGETWTQLAATSEKPEFQNINRLIVDPNDENIIVVATSNRVEFESGIFKSTDGGLNWTNSILDSSTSRKFQQIVATPGNFNVQYAAAFGEGVYKSTDAGSTWVASSTGMAPDGRLEIGVSPVNASKVFASAEGSITPSELYVSSDAGATWSLVDVSFNNTPADFLGGQGWYDQIMLCAPYNENVVYVGGVSVIKVELGSGGSSTQTVINMEENGTSAFMSFTNFSASQIGGILEILDGENPSEDTLSVEVRFGPGLTQKAHRFSIPADGGADGNGGAGIPDTDYTYVDYVDVPFEVWDVETNRQLMVSFRDQEADGKFNLNPRDDANDPDLLTAREYLFISNLDYSATADPDISTASAGHLTKNMYFFWPVLTAGATWDENNLPASSLDIVVSDIEVLSSNVDVAADPYGAFDGTNAFNTFGVDVHPDQHGIVAIKEDDANETFRILLSNDGGPFISNISTDPGVTEGDWTMVGNTYNTAQFYGADKKPGEDAYFGGMQDNGTWQSSVNADATTNYDFKIGGDGFEVLWHSQDPDKLIGGSQGNNFARSTDGGASFSNATSGLSGDHPFISKLANSKALSEVIYTVSSAGVFKSEDFGGQWNLTAITDFWDNESASSFLDVDVSRANPNIVWAGSGMNSEDRRIYVSTDQGATFTETNSSNEVSGTITRLATHPTQPNTAYVMFSFARSAKILKTEDLGETWTDISGFGTNSTSSTGFPDVAVYCLYVHADDPNILWAGTDIGIVESIDNGATWHLLDHEMPRVAVWDMKGQDNQVIIATHGRGIWTATLDESQTEFKASPTVAAFGTSPQENLVISVNALEPFDSTEIYLNDDYLSTYYNIVQGDNAFELEGVSTGNNKELKLRSYLDGIPVYSDANIVQLIDLFEEAGELSDLLSSDENFELDGAMGIYSLDGTSNGALQSPHNYPINSNLIAFLRQPIIVSAGNSIFSYEDMAMIQPGSAGSSFGEDAFNDYVVVEATTDGLNWIPIEDGYDASFKTSWKAAYDGSAEINKSLYENHAIDLTNKFTVGDTLLFRFRLFSNADIFGWGWAIDNLYIQTEPLGLERAKDVIGYSVYPVPSRGNLTLEYQLASSSDVFLEISSITGQKIKAYDLGSKPSGIYRFILNDYNLESGAYIFSLKTKSGISSQRVLISK